MNRTPLILTSIVGLWIAVILQQSIAVRLSIFGARPDFLLLFIVPLSLLTSRPGGTLLGFFAGLLQGATTGVFMAQYVASRTIAGFMASWSRGFGMHVNWGVACVTTIILTIVARLIYMFLAAPPGVMRFLGDTIGSAMYNGVLAIPVYMLLQWVIDPKVRSGLR
jgi:rod shape-determining protein MreD